MQTNPIPGVMNTLKDAKFNEDQRMAIVTAITEMQYPLLEAIEGLKSEIKADVDRLSDRLGNQTLVLAGTVIASHIGVLAILKLF